MSGGTCHCLCRFWDHDPAICNGRLDRVIELDGIGDGEVVKVPVCRPCGADIAEAELALPEREERPA